MTKRIVLTEAEASASTLGVQLLRAEVEDSAPKNSEDALALSFADQQQDVLRYVAVWRRWLTFGQYRWATDETRVVQDMVRKHCRVSAIHLPERDAKLLASAKTVEAVERLARSDRRLAATTDQWDSNPYLLNTPRGVIDLQSGEVRQTKSDDYLTKVAAVGPGPDCPLWLQFIDEITNGDQQLADFLQRVAGYSLSGDTSEHAMFFLYGTGANGKSVFVSTLSGILGDYHRAAPIETFTASVSERHPTELAMLRGARLVTVIETEEGKNWAESRIKALTGGDVISARFMRQDFFDYLPQFKLLVTGNHKPSLRNVDEAIRRRLLLIPFRVTIPMAQRDKDLAAKLKAEWPGILRWALEGYNAWRLGGLTPPPSVAAATDAYFEAEDSVGNWIAECCNVGGTEDQLATLFRSWKSWAEANGELPRSNKWLARSLESRGYKSFKTSKGLAFGGLNAGPRSSRHRSE